MRVSAVIGQPVADDIARVMAHREGTGGGTLIDCLEARAATAGEVHVLGGHLPSDMERFIELAPVPELDALMAAVRGIGASAKIRMGGTEQTAFPAPG